MTHRHRLLLLATTALMPLSVGMAHANPLGGQVVGGSATIAGQGTSTVTVTQTSQNAAINWNTFNIGAGQTTQFVQPNANSVMLDRVTGGLGPSQIFGNLISNGIVFLVNPNGILFGRGSQVNVGGLLATTHDIKTGDVMAGRYNFNISGNPSASVVNQGTITAASGGFAGLVAPGVRNAGVITATLGTVGLAAGNSFTLDLYGDNLIKLAPSDAIAKQVLDVATGKPLSSLITNTGKLSANGGRVQITAAAAKAIVNSVINNKGVIEANSIGQRNGMIVLGAATGKSKPAGAPAQTVKISGTLSASGTQSGTTGGTILITGENIALAGATIDASGKAGGGTVLIGGAGGGGNPAVPAIPQALAAYLVPAATTVSIDAASTINASGIANGNGGHVGIWSAQLTTVAGLIKATGGAQGGNGGLVETSGGTVNFAGLRVDTSAPAGKTGTWLVDPTDLTVDAAAAAAIAANLATTNVTLQTNADGTTSGPGNPSNGPGDIIVAAPISWSSANALTLLAYNNVSVNAPISLTNGTLNLTAGNAITVNATIGIAGAGALNLTAAPDPTYGIVQLSFGNGGSVQFTGTPNIGQSLSINGQPYTLLYSMTDVQNISAGNLSGNYALAKPLDATGVSNWIPIGTDGAGNPNNGGNGFNGTFQGLGNIITNLVINLPTNNSAGDNASLFGYVGPNGIIANVGLIGSSVTGEYNVGALVGSNADMVSQSYATGTVSGTALVGGLVGYNTGNILQSHAIGTVSGSSGCVTAGGLCLQYALGGLIGYNDNKGTVSDSEASGAVGGSGCLAEAVPCGQFELGGLVGYNAGVVLQSNAAGAVTGVISGGGVSGAVGGLVGYNIGAVSLSHATGAASGADLVGGLVGLNNGGNISQSSATGVVSGGSGGSSCVNGVCGQGGLGGLVGYNTGMVSLSYATGAVTVGIGTVGVGGLVGYNDSNGTVSDSHATGVVTGGSGSSFVGGLVGLNSGTISQLSYATGTVMGDSGAAGVGGLVGGNYGTVIQSYANGTVRGAGGSDAAGDAAGGLGGLVGGNCGTVTQSHATGVVTGGSGSSFVGGLVGFNSGTVSGTASQPSYATGAVTGDSGTDAVGGLVGYNSGTVSGVAFQPAYATGAVTGGSGILYVGGLVGFNDSGATVSQTRASGAVIGSVLTPSAAGAAKPQDGYIGGLVGYNRGAVSYSTASGPVTALSSIAVGGLVGFNAVTFDNANNLTGTGSITNSSETGNVTGGITAALDNTSYYVGGLAGANAGTITASTAHGNVTGFDYVGGLIGIESVPMLSNSNLNPVNAIAPPPTVAVSHTQNACVIAGAICVTGTSDSASFATGTVTGVYNVGEQIGFVLPLLTPVQINTSLDPLIDDTAQGSRKVKTPITLAAKGQGATIGAGKTGGLGRPGPTGATAAVPPLVGGNGAPPGMRLIDMPVIPLPPGSGLPPPSETRFPPDEVLFQIGNAISPQQVEAIARRFGLTVAAAQPIAMLGRTVYTFRIPDGRSIREIIRLIEASGVGGAAQPNYVYDLEPAGVPGPTPGDPAQYVIGKFQLAETHRLARGDNVVVAVIDSAVDADHPDLAGAMMNQFDAGCGAAAPDAHGTGMAGAIAAHRALLGVAPNVKIMAICAFVGDGASTRSNTISILKALDYAVQQGARVINMSYTGPYDKAMAQALQIAREKGIVLVGAAGNAGPNSPPLYPAADPNVIAVTATDQDDHVFRDANHGKYIAVAAPGVDILVPAPGGNVQLTTGTSVAAAEVSGVAALLLAQNPKRTPEQIRAILMSTAKDLGPKGFDPQYGAGLVDPLKALQFAPVVSQR